MLAVCAMIGTTTLAATTTGNPARGHDGEPHETTAPTAPARPPTALPRAAPTQTTELELESARPPDGPEPRQEGCGVPRGPIR
jgi:hypothetical protein